MFGLNKKEEQPPRWFGFVLILMLLPLLCYPFLGKTLLGQNVEGIDNEMMRFIIYALPFYALVSQWLSYRIYNERKLLSWILQTVLLMVYLGCMWLVHCVGGF